MKSKNMDMIASSVSKADFKLKSMDMIEKFNDISEKFTRHLESGSIDLSGLKLVLKRYLKYKPIYENDDNEELTPKQLKSMSTAVEIMDVFASFCTFFNYKLLEKAMKAVNYEEGISLMEKYEEDFEAYVKDRVVGDFVGQSQLNLPPNNRSSVLKVKLDDTYSECKKEYLDKLKTDISKILQVEELELAGIMSGSICVTFYIVGALNRKLFPLNELQIDAVRKLSYMGARVLQISCNGVVYYPEIQFPCKFIIRI